MVLRAATRCGRPRCCSPRRTARSSARVAMSFLRMSIGGEEVEGRHAGPPRDRPRLPRAAAIFAELEAANEERARELGVRLLLIVPNAASAPVLRGRLGWRQLPSLRVWARPRLLRGRPRARGASSASTRAAAAGEAAGATACSATPPG